MAWWREKGMCGSGTKYTVGIPSLNMKQIDFFFWMEPTYDTSFIASKAKGLSIMNDMGPTTRDYIGAGSPS